MQNKIYANKDAKLPMTNSELAKAEPRSTDYDGSFLEERIIGPMCDCEGAGEFNLEPPDFQMVIDGGKRYMQCRKCGIYSHL